MNETEKIKSAAFSEKQSVCAKRVRLLKKNATECELIIQRKLNEIGINAIFQKGFIAGQNFVIVDFYIPKFKLVLEVDGEYHQSFAQKKRDKNRDLYLKQRRFHVLHITNEIARKIIPGDLKKLIMGFDAARELIKVSYIKQS